VRTGLIANLRLVEDVRRGVDRQTTSKRAG